MNEATLDGLISATAKLTAICYWSDKRREADLLLKKNCGNCEHWMKRSDCPAEARGEKPSMNRAPCGKHQMKQQDIDLHRQRVAEAEANLARLAGDGKQT